MNKSEAHFFILTRDHIIFEERKHDFEVMRLQTFYQMSPYYGKKNKPRKPSSLMPFSWDPVIKIDINPEDFNEDAFKRSEDLFLREG